MLKDEKLTSITDVPGVKVGQAQDEEAMTGVTVILVPEGAIASVDVRGAAPGTRETDFLDPSNLVQKVNAIALCGGRVLGLAAADLFAALPKAYRDGLADLPATVAVLESHAAEA